MSRASLAYRLERKTRTDPNGCRVWLGLRTRDGYGRTTIGGRDTVVHRAVYEAHVGPVPERMVLDHKCRNRACCNPEHLEPVTARENILRGELSNRAGKCRQGHDVPGGGRCLVCRAARQREWYERKRAAMAGDEGATVAELRALARGGAS